jgi:hypothetical protein
MHSQGHSKLHVRGADYTLLQSQKADTTTFVVSKKRTLQTFLVDGLCIVYSLSVNFVVYVRLFAVFCSISLNFAVHIQLFVVFCSL